MPPMLYIFYENLQKIYIQQEFQQISFGVRMNLGLMPLGMGWTRFWLLEVLGMSTLLFIKERKWILVLTCINANGDDIYNFYIFKGIKARRDYLALCEIGSTFGLQKNEWIDTY